MKIYGIKNCNNVEKAIQFLKKRGIKYEFVDLQECNLTKTQITEWINCQSLDRLINKESRLYNKLNLKEKSEEEKKEIICKEVLLIKRPLIEFADGCIIIGFDESEYEDIFD